MDTAVLRLTLRISDCFYPWHTKISGELQEMLQPSLIFPIFLSYMLMTQRHPNDGTHTKKVELALYSKECRDDVMSMAHACNAKILLKEQKISVRPNAAIPIRVQQDSAPLKLYGEPVEAPLAGEPFQRVYQVNLNPLQSQILPKTTQMHVLVGHHINCLKIDEADFHQEITPAPTTNYNVSMTGNDNTGMVFNSGPKSCPNCDASIDSLTTSNSTSRVFSDTTATLSPLTTRRNGNPRSKALGTTEDRAQADTDGLEKSLMKPNGINTRSLSNRNGSKYSQSSTTLVKTGRMVCDRSTASTVNNSQTEGLTTTGNYKQTEDAAPGTENQVFSQERETTKYQVGATRYQEQLISELKRRELKNTELEESWYDVSPADPTEENVELVEKF